MDRELFRRGYLPVLAGAFFISFSAFFVKGAAMDPAAIAFYRPFFGALILFPVAALRGNRLAPSRSLLALIGVTGFVFSVDNITWHISIVSLGPGIATILGNFEVIFLALIGVFFFKERMNWTQRLSIPLALAGLALLLGLHEKSLPGDSVRGVVYGLVSAVFYAFYVLAVRRSQSVPDRLAPAANIAWVSAAGAFFAFAYCLVSGRSLVIPDLRTGIALACLGVFCQSLGWLLLSMGLPHLPPFRAGLLILLQPALSFLWDILVYGAPASPVNILGAALAIVAIGMGIR